MSKKFPLKTFSVGGLNGVSICALIFFVVAVAVSFYVGNVNVPPVVMVVLASSVFLFTGWLLSSARIKITDEFLIAGGGWYKVKIPWSNVLFDDIEALPLNSSFKLRWRINGLGWPGLSLGWFSSNGEKRVFAAVAGKRNRVYIPLREKFDMVVTPVDIDVFLKELNARR